jgi:hypothetical protein
MEGLMTQEIQGNWWSGPSVDVSQSDIRPIVRNQLNILNRDITSALRSGGFDRATRTHLEDLQMRVQDVLDGDD